MQKYVHHGVIRKSETMKSTLSQFSIGNLLNKLWYSHSMAVAMADFKIILRINILYEGKYDMLCLIRKITKHCNIITFFICIEKIWKGTHQNVNKISLWVVVIVIFTLHLFVSSGFISINVLFSL